MNSTEFVCMHFLVTIVGVFVCLKNWYFRFLCDFFKIPCMEGQCCLAVSGLGTYAEQVP